MAESVATACEECAKQRQKVEDAAATIVWLSEELRIARMRYAIAQQGFVRLVEQVNPLFNQKVAQARVAATEVL